MTTEYQDAPENVRLIQGEPGEYLAPAQRTPAEKHRDQVIETATDHAESAESAVAVALEWLEVVTVVPKRLRALPVLAAQLREFIEDERRRLG
jgi:hypothetical protein